MAGAPPLPVGAVPYTPQSEPALPAGAVAIDPPLPPGATPVTPQRLPQTNPSYPAGPQLTGLDAKIQDAALRHGLDPGVFRNLIRTESSFRANAISPAGAVGLSQLMPATTKDMGVKDPLDIDQNLEGGAKYLRQMLDRYNGNYELALTAYNAGPGNVDKHGVEARNVPGADPNYFHKILNNIQPAVANLVPPQIRESLFGKSSALMQFTENVNHVAQGIAAPAMAGMKYLDAIVGAPERVVAGAINQHYKSHEVGWSGADIMRGLYVATHPLNDDLQQKENKALVDRTLTHFGLSTTDTGVKRLVEEVAVQSAYDPVSFLAVGDALKVGGVVKKVATDMIKAVPGAPPALRAFLGSVQDVGEKLGARQLADIHEKLMTTRPELNPYLTPVAKGARLSIEGRNEFQFSHIQQMDRSLVKKFPEIKTAADYPSLSPAAKDAVDHRNQFEAWAFGDQDLRDHVLKTTNFKPTAEETKMFPTPAGTLRFGAQDYVHDYDPLMLTAAQKAAHRAAGGKEYTEVEQEYFNRYGDRGMAGFEKKRKNPTGQAQTAPFGERILYRWNTGRELAKRRLVDEETRSFLAAHPSEWKGKTGLTPDKQVKELSHEPEPAFGASSPFSVLENSTLLKTSRALQARGISGNPFPHGLKNVGMLAYIEGGPFVFARGLMHAMGLGGANVAMRAGQTVDATTTVADRMARLGLMTNYDVDRMGGWAAGIYNVPGLKQLDKTGQVAVERLENGFRASMLEQADRKFGPSVTDADEFRKAQYVRDFLGDYRNVNAIVQAFKTIGGPFVAFRLGIVPKAIGLAMTKPLGIQRLESLARTENDVNDPKTGFFNKIQGGARAAFETGGPVADMSKLANPAKSGQYIGSSATVGAAGEGLALGAQATQGRFDPVMAGANLARSFIPGVSLVEGIPLAAAGINPYTFQKEHLPGTTPLARALAQVMGSYFREIKLKEARDLKSKRRSSDKQTRKTMETYDKFLGGK